MEVAKILTWRMTIPAREGRTKKRRGKGPLVTGTTGRATKVKEIQIMGVVIKARAVGEDYVSCVKGIAANGEVDKGTMQAE